MYYFEEKGDKFECKVISGTNMEETGWGLVEVKSRY